MLYSFQNTVLRPLTSDKTCPQTLYRLMMVAVDDGDVAQKGRDKSCGVGGMSDIALQILMVRYEVVQRAAEVDVQCLQPAADAENGQTVCHEKTDRGALLCI